MKDLIPSLISLAMAGAVIYGFVVKLIDPNLFLAIATGAVAYWYKTKDKVQSLYLAFQQGGVLRAWDEERHWLINFDGIF